MKAAAAGLTEVKPREKNINLLPSVELKNLPMTKILTIENQSLKTKDSEIYVKRSWLLYIPAGLIEIHPHKKYQLATVNRPRLI